MPRARIVYKIKSIDHNFFAQWVGPGKGSHWGIVGAE